jgi:uncharacterized membrane protein|tara:strand:- start:360 stop:566 length:207 start_codon:yes stop_codon:yes gene_type:complete
MKSPIEGHPNLYKDKETGVIVNRASSERDRYRIAKQQSRNSMNTEQEISSLRDEIDEIKSLLKQLINK